MLQAIGTMPNGALSTLGKEISTATGKSDSGHIGASASGQRLLLQAAKLLASSSTLQQKIGSLLTSSDTQASLSQTLAEGGLARAQFLGGLPTGAGQSLLSLSCEENASLFYDGLYRLALSLENSWNNEQVPPLLFLLAKQLKNVPSDSKLGALKTKINGHLRLYQGKGSFGAQLAFGVRQMAHDKRSLSTLTGMGLGMSAFGLTRLALVQRGVGTLRAGAGAFAAEGLLFTGGEIATERALGLASHQNVGTRLLHGYATMGILRGVGTFFGALGRSGFAQAANGRSAVARLGFKHVLPRVTEISGLSLSNAILAGQNPSEALRTGVQGAVHFAFLRGALHSFAPRFAAFNHQVALKTQGALYQQGLRWQTMPKMAGSLFTPARRPAALGPQVMAMSHHGGRLPAGQRKRRFWEGVEDYGDGYAPMRPPRRPISKRRTQPSRLEEKREVISRVLFEVLGLKSENRKHQRRISAILIKDSRVGAFYALHQIPHGPDPKGTLLKHAMTNARWRDFLSKLPKDAAKGLQKMANENQALEADSLVRRFFETEWFLDSAKRDYGREASWATLFLKVYPQLRRVPGFGQISSQVTQRFGIKIRKNNDGKRIITWETRQHQDAWAMEVSKTLALADILRQEATQPLGNIRGLKFWLHDKISLITSAGPQDIRFQVDLKRTNGWADLVYINRGSLSSYTLSQNHDLGSFIHRARRAQAALESGQVEGFNFHLFADHVSPDVLRILGNLIPNLRVIKHEPSEHGGCHVLVNQREGKPVSENI